MAVFAAVVLRLAVLAFAGVLLAGAALTLEAERVDALQPLTPTPSLAKPAAMTVPDVTGQAYVFAKGILQDNGYAWHVTGPVLGYAGNVVALQQPAAGVRVVDTGAPTILLTLGRNPSYGEVGTPDNDSPYPGTRIVLVPGSTPPAPPVRLQPVPVPQAPVVTQPTTQPTQTVTAPIVTTPAVTTPTTTTPAPVQPTPTPTPTTPTAAPQARQPDFVVPGGPKEPAQAVSLPDRAQKLAAWLEAHKQPTSANLNYWLYEHAYIVAGSKFGWWHGAQALALLIDIDRRAEQYWGVGRQSEIAAAQALSDVEARRQ